jgi:hypothetical protein
MTQLEPASSGERPLTQELWYAARYYLGSRTGIVLMAAAALGAGACLNWGWLVAAGLAPVIISVLPCAAMCALGLCMSGHSRPSASNETPSAEINAGADTSTSLRLAGEADTHADKSGQKGKGCC